MKKAFVLILVGLIVTSAGCIRKEGSLIIIDLSNLTKGLENQTANQTTTTTTEPTMYTYEELVYVGGNLTIKELNFIIKPDYDVSKQSFFFVTTNGVYWEPMDIEVEDVKIHGEGYWAGETTYVARIVITSSRELTITVNNPEG